VLETFFMMWNVKTALSHNFVDRALFDTPLALGEGFVDVSVTDDNVSIHFN